MVAAVLEPGTVASAGFSATITPYILTCESCLRTLESATRQTERVQPFLPNESCRWFHISQNLLNNLHVPHKQFDNMATSADVEKPSRGHELLLVQIVFVSLAGASTLIRAYVKIFLVGRVTADDYLIFAAMVSSHILFSVEVPPQENIYLTSSTRLLMLRMPLSLLTVCSMERRAKISLSSTQATKPPDLYGAGIYARHCTHQSPSPSEHQSVLCCSGSPPRLLTV